MTSFRERIWEYYHDFGRDLPWREDLSPYHVFVSEIMLQQTQVSRVLVKYAQWMQVFPDFASVGDASVGDVLAVWQGLGYNRRGLWLREAAITIVRDHHGVLPDDPVQLVKLKGIGVNTAGSIAAFAHNRPVVFIETNIRRVFLHEFFPGQEGVPDTELKPLIGRELDLEHPREWYWALMDYGSYLAKQVPNPNRQSKHYAVQSKFEGSMRQLRGEVLRQLLSAGGSVTVFAVSDSRLERVLTALDGDGFIQRSGEAWRLAS